MALLLLASCAHEKTFKRWDGKRIEAKPYGWANEQPNKIEGVKYQINFGNIVWDIIGSEIILVPVYLTGYQLFEPVSYEFEN